MARNEEKHFGKLNRIILAKLKEDQLKKHPRRPKLEVLDSVEDIRRWLPSITKDLEFNLAQSQVPCYPVRVIEEFHQKIDSLKREYQAFVRKLRSLDPSCTVTPWTNRAYDKRKLQLCNAATSPVSKEKRRKPQASFAADNTEIVLSEKTDKSPALPCEMLTLPVLDKTENVNNTDHSKVIKDLSCERLALPILDSQTEQLYKEDRERGDLEVTWNSDNKSETCLTKTERAGNIRNSRKVMSHLRKRHFAPEYDSEESLIETEETTTQSTPYDGDNSVYNTMQSEYGFHNDKQLDFGTQPLKPSFVQSSNSEFSGVVGYSSSDED